MSVRGLWQLRRLVVSYCDWGGSSRGARYGAPHASLGLRPMLGFSCSAAVPPGLPLPQTPRQALARRRGFSQGSTVGPVACLSLVGWGALGERRDFVASVLPGWAAQNPQLEVVQQLRRGQHPFLQGVFGQSQPPGCRLLPCPCYPSSATVPLFLLLRALCCTSSCACWLSAQAAAVAPVDASLEVLRPPCCCGAMGMQPMAERKWLG